MYVYFSATASNVKDSSKIPVDKDPNIGSIGTFVDEIMKGKSLGASKSRLTREIGQTELYRNLNI